MLLDLINQPYLHSSIGIFAQLDYMNTITNFALPSSLTYYIKLLYIFG